MRNFSTVLTLVTCALSGLVKAQSPTVPLNPDSYRLIDRYEIKLGRWADGFHSSFKPYNRHQIIQLTDSLMGDSLVQLSTADRFNLQYLRDDSWEWLSASARDSASPAFFQLNRLGLDYSATGDSRRPLAKVLYRKKSDLYYFENEDVDIHVSPAVSFGYGFETLNNRSEFQPSSVRQNPFLNSRGIEIRGSIRKRLGFYTFLSDNQAIFPSYYNEYRNTYGLGSGITLAPGEGLAKEYSSGGLLGADYIAARGYITFNALKVINIQFGHDKNFIGNGIRSLFLSDNSAPHLFLKFTTRLGRFQYTNLYTELQNTQVPVNPTEPFIKKYAAMHHLSINLGRHVNVGVFEAVVHSRDHLELNYLNPIILYRFLESYQNSADNALMGIDYKVNFLRHFLVYGQFMLDEFLIKDIRAGEGSWTNKFALQAGLKYIDAFGIPNLDVQGEFNMARPYTYAHRSGQTNYVHYNQPLAHPLGANFVEGLGIINYQPYSRWTVTGIFGVMRYGADPPSRNYGGNLLLSYDTRFRDKGNYITQGRETIISYGDLRLTFMPKHNIFIDFRQNFRVSDSQLSRLRYSSALTSIALRWNMPYKSMIL